MIFYDENNKKLISIPIFFLLFLFGHLLTLYLHLSYAWLISLSLVSLALSLKYNPLLFLTVFLLGLFNGSLFMYPKLSHTSLDAYQLTHKTLTLEGIVKTVKNRTWSQIGKLHIQALYYKNKKIALKGQISLKNSSKKRFQLGDRVLLRGQLSIPEKAPNYGGFNYKNYLKQKGIFYTLKIKKSRDVEVLSQNNNSLLVSLQHAIQNRILSFSKEQKVSGFYLSILLGDKTYLDKDLKNNMLSLGIIHLLAISGFHIALLFSVIYLFILSLLRLSLTVVQRVDVFKASLSFSILFIFLYLIIIDFQTSATRATIMITLFSLAKIIERKFNPLHVLSLAGILILIFDSSAFTSIGFYLSFLAVLAFFIPIKLIKAYTKPQKTSSKQKLNQKLKEYFLSYLSVNLVIFLVTTPIILFTFYKVSYGQLFFNLLFIPLFSFITYPLALFSFVFKSQTLLEFNYTLFNSLAQALQGDYYLLNPINTWQLILALLILSTMFFLLYHKKTTYLLLALLAYVALLLYPASREPSGLNLYFLSVGNGDATLITYKGKSVLIDAGSKKHGNNGQRVILPHLNYLNIKKLDYVIITHADEDHIGGLIDLLEAKRVKKLILDFPLPEHYPKTFTKLERSKNIQLKDLNIHLDYSQNFKDDNNNSIIAYFNYQGRKILLMGDAEKEREQQFLKQHPSQKNIDLLKAGHHGAKTSSSSSFLATIKPKFTLLSSGKNNRYKHPHQEVLQRLNKVKTQIFRTDQQGEVIFNIQKQIKVKTLLSPSF